MTSTEFKKLDSYHRREYILDIACDLFSKKGYDAVTTLELASELGCSETMLLGIFPAKAEIYNALFDEWRVIASKPPTLKKINNSPLDTLEKFFNDFISLKYSRDQALRPKIERALYSRTSDNAKQHIHEFVSTAPDFVSHAIEPLIIEGQKIGEIRDGNAKELAAFTWALIQGSYYSKKDFTERYKTIPTSSLRGILQKQN